MDSDDDSPEFRHDSDSGDEFSVSDSVSSDSESNPNPGRLSDDGGDGFGDDINPLGDGNDRQRGRRGRGPSDSEWKWNVLVGEETYNPVEWLEKEQGSRREGQHLYSADRKQSE